MRVVWNGCAGGGVPSSPTHTPRSAGDQVGAVERAVEPERLAQLGRPAAQVAVAAGPGRAARIAVDARRAATSARSSTATPSPSSPHTTLAHQCMP